MIQISGITFFSTSTSTARTAAASEHLTRRAGQGWLPIFLSLTKEVFCCEITVRYVLDFDLTSKFNSAGNRELEKFCRPLCMLGHGNKEMFAPTRHPRFCGGNNCLATQKETSLVLFDHKVLQSAGFYDIADRRRLHETKVSDNSEKTVREIFNFNARVFLDVRYAVGDDCEHNIALV